MAQNFAKHFREMHFGGNWTTTNLKDLLSDMTWEEAIQRPPSFNTIAAITYHTHYYVHAVLQVLQGGELRAKDELSFDHPSIHSQEDWNRFLEHVWSDAEAFANALETVPDERFNEEFIDTKYGSYFRNIAGIIEHTHYHLGQIALIKKLIRNQ